MMPWCNFLVSVEEYQGEQKVLEFSKGSNCPIFLS